MSALSAVTLYPCMMPAKRGLFATSSIVRSLHTRTRDRPHEPHRRTKAVSTIHGGNELSVLNGGVVSASMGTVQVWRGMCFLLPGG